VRKVKNLVHSESTVVAKFWTPITSTDHQSLP